MILRFLRLCLLYPLRRYTFLIVQRVDENAIQIGRNTIKPTNLALINSFCIVASFPIVAICPE